MAWDTHASLGKDFKLGCLRSLAESDIRGMLEWMHDPSVNRWFVRDFSSMDEDGVLGFIRESWSDVTSFHLAVDDGAGGYLGTISLKSIDYMSKSAEYAIAMRLSSHGTGASANATRDLFRLARERMSLNAIYLNVLKENGRARAFYEKMGFKLQDEVSYPARIYYQDKKSNLVWYMIELKDN